MSCYQLSKLWQNSRNEQTIDWALNDLKTLWMLKNTAVYSTKCTVTACAKWRVLSNYKHDAYTVQLVYVIIRIRVQFGINLHEWVFQKAEIARAASASVVSASWKTRKCKLTPNWTRKTVRLLINNINMKKKNLRGGSAEVSFLKPFFLIRENFFQSFCTKFSSSFYVISLA